MREVLRGKEGGRVDGREGGIVGEMHMYIKVRGKARKKEENVRKYECCEG